MIESAHELAIRAKIAAAGLLTPEAVVLGSRRTSVAVAFRIGASVETFGGVGESDAALAADIIRQLRYRLAHTREAGITRARRAAVGRRAGPGATPARQPRRESRLR